MASSTADRPPSPLLQPSGLRPGQLAAIGLITVAVALLAIEARATYGARVTSDEPQYLLSALSLAEDLDLDIADELANERFLPFHEVPLDPQTIELDEGGQRLSPHDPLLPALLAPGMAAGGWRGARVVLATLAGLTAATTAFVAANRLGIGNRAAAVAVTGLFATPPLTTYGSQVYPEMPAALAVVAALAGLLGESGPNGGTRGRRLLVIGAIVALPWLSAKYVPVAGVLAIALVASNRSPERRRSAVVITLALTVAGAVYLLAHQRMYGGWTVYAAGDHFVDGEFDVVGRDPDYPGRSRRLIGLLIDRRFGLGPWAPAYLLLVPAVGAAVARRSWPRPLLLALLGAGWATATWLALTMHGWWWPGRQVVGVLPVAALIIGWLIDGRPRLVLVTAAASVLAAANWLWLVVEASTGRRTLIVDFHETGAPLHRLLAPLFPDHTVNDWGDEAMTVFWIAAAVIAGLVGWSTERRRAGCPAGAQPAAPSTSRPRATSGPPPS